MKEQPFETRNLRREIEELENSDPETFARVGEKIEIYGANLHSMIGELAIITAPQT